MDIAHDHYVTEEVIVRWRALGGLVIFADVFCRSCHRMGLVIPPKVYRCGCGVSIFIPTDDVKESQPEIPQAYVGVIKWITQ